MATVRKGNTRIIPGETIIRKIYIFRSQKIILDSDLADLYGVETKVLKQAVRRNKNRFPVDFMFQLNKKEFAVLRSQFVTSNRGGTRYLPYAFTEQGVAMLSGIINSPKAVKINIAIMRAFVEMRKLAHTNKKIAEQIKKLMHRIGEHDVQLNAIYGAIEDLLDKKASEEKWTNRPRIGFK